MSDPTAASAEPCGAWGGCKLPAGHNVGRADIPANHPSPIIPPSGHFMSGLRCEVLAFAVVREWEGGDVEGLLMGRRLPDDGSGYVTTRVNTSNRGRTWWSIGTLDHATIDEARDDFLFCLRADRSWRESIDRV